MPVHINEFEVEPQAAAPAAPAPAAAPDPRVLAAQLDEELRRLAARRAECEARLYAD